MLCCVVVLDTTDVTDIPDEAPSSITAPSSTTIQPTMSDTTLITNEEEAFALEPLDTTSMVTGMYCVSPLVIG